MSKMKVRIKGKFYAKDGVLYKQGLYLFPETWKKSDFPKSATFLSGPFADGVEVEAEADEVVALEEPNEPGTNGEPVKDDSEPGPSTTKGTPKPDDNPPAEKKAPDLFGTKTKS